MTATSDPNCKPKLRSSSRGKVIGGMSTIKDSSKVEKKSSFRVTDPKKVTLQDDDEAHPGRPASSYRVPVADHSHDENYSSLADSHDDSHDANYSSSVSLLLLKSGLHPCRPDPPGPSTESTPQAAKPTTESTESAKPTTESTESAHQTATESTESSKKISKTQQLLSPYTKQLNNSIMTICNTLQQHEFKLNSFSERLSQSEQTLSTLQSTIHRIIASIENIER